MLAVVGTTFFRDITDVDLLSLTDKSFFFPKFDNEKGELFFVMFLSPFMPRIFAEFDFIRAHIISRRVFFFFAFDLIS